MLKLELCVCLIPTTVDSTFLECLSSDIMRTNKNCYVRLGNSDDRLSLAPHLTLYQFPVYINMIDNVISELEVISKGFQTITLSSNKFNYNADEGSFEIIYNNDDRLSRLQQQMVEEMNKLRKGLILEKDPSNHKPDVNNQNIRDYGFAEINDKFKPHTTLNWFDFSSSNNTPEVFSFPQSKAPLPQAITFDRMGVFILGPQGTCCQALERWKFE